MHTDGVLLQAPRTLCRGLSLATGPCSTGGWGWGPWPAGIASGISASRSYSQPAMNGSWWINPPHTLQVGQLQGVFYRLFQKSPVGLNFSYPHSNLLMNIPCCHFLSFSFFLFYFLSWFTMLWQSAVQQSDSVIHIETFFFKYSFPIWFITGHWI